MFHLILTACLAGPSAPCVPILLPQGDAASGPAGRQGAARISKDWLDRHSDLVADGTECVPTEDLPALDLRQVAPGVFAFFGQPVQLEDSADGRIANLGVVIGQDSVAVIDTGVSRMQGQQLYAAIRRLTPKPVSHVILTHMHPDHVLGTSVFQEAGAQVLGHHALPLALQMRAGGYLDNIARLLPPEEVLGSEVVLPDTTVQDSLRIDLGGRSLLLRAEQTAHTDNDLTAFDDTTSTLFSGDLIFRELTPIVDGSLTGWLGWIAAPPQPEPRVIVPGHGDVAREWQQAIAPQSDFLKALADVTRSQIDAGTPLSEAVEIIVNNLNYMNKNWNSFPASVARDATAAYKELEWE